MRLSSVRFRLPPLPAGPSLARLGLQILLLLAALLLCWQAARLVALLLSWPGRPAALSMPAAAVRDTSSAREALGRWFAAADKGPAPVLPNLQLLAVAAGPRGVALLGGLPDGTRAVAVGEELIAGTRLVEVLPDHIVLERAGARSEVAFPTSNAASLFGPGNAPAALQDSPLLKAATPARAAPPAAASEPVITREAEVSRGKLTAAAQGGNLGDWDKGLEAFPAGGIRVTDASRQPLAQVLNLQNGDVLREVNGRAITQLADISLVYHHFSQSSEVSLSVLRDGKPQQLTFKIQP